MTQLLTCATACARAHARLCRRTSTALRKMASQAAGAGKENCNDTRAASPAALITIRAYEPEDCDEVVRIFCDGMRGLPTVLVQQLLRNSTAQIAVASAAVVLCAVTGPAIAIPVTLTIIPLLLFAAYMCVRYGVMEQYVQQSLQDDLVNISAAYDRCNGSCFWVAEQSTGGAKPCILGCVGLQQRRAGVAELRRMSVSRTCRRNGVGRRLTEVLIQHAKEAGFKVVVLETSSLQPPAIRLYQAFGWQEVGKQAMAGGLVLIHKLVLRLAT